MIITLFAVTIYTILHFKDHPETYGDGVGINGIGWGITAAFYGVSAEVAVDLTLFSIYYLFSKMTAK